LAINSGSAVLYVKREMPGTTPPWTKLLTKDQKLPDNIFGKSNTVGAALVIRESEHVFVLTFGSGFHLLKNESIERDFGLKVTLNSVDPDKLRSLDKASYDHNPLNSRTQSAKDLDIFELHIDSELDMLYAVTGASKVNVFGSHVTGRDALTLMVEIDLNGISAVLKEALARYTSPLPKEFEWVENINRVKDSEVIELLDMELDDTLSKPNEGSIWLGEPEIIDWESQIGYSFDLYQKTPRHVVLEFKDLIEYFQLHKKPLCVESLKDQTVHINNSEYQSFKNWKAYRCLYAEIKVGQEQYILRNGIWYRVDMDFVSSIDSYLKDIAAYQHKLPTYNHDREEEYNQHVTDLDDSYSLMDKKNIKIGGPYDKLEFCDLIKDGADFIHVKYYRSSATLSHLFSQGSVAAEAFVRDSEFREKLNQKLPECTKLKNPANRPNPSDYRVIYAIATSKKLPHELPFFSKVTLKNALKTLRALDYKVELASIEVDPVLLVKKKGKPQKKTKLA